MRRACGIGPTIFEIQLLTKLLSSDQSPLLLTQVTDASKTLRACNKLIPFQKRKIAALPELKK